MNNSDNAALRRRLSIPPMTDGVVGPNHLRAAGQPPGPGLQQGGRPGRAPVQAEQPLVRASADTCAAQDAGDPIVLYDPLADRWMLSQFAFIDGVGNPSPLSPVRRDLEDARSDRRVLPVRLRDAGQRVPRLSPPRRLARRLLHDRPPVHASAALSTARASTPSTAPRCSSATRPPSLIYFDLSLRRTRSIGGMLPVRRGRPDSAAAGTPNTFVLLHGTASFGDPADALRLFDFHADFAVPGTFHLHRDQSTYPARSPSRLRPASTPAGNRASAFRSRLRRPSAAYSRRHQRIASCTDSPTATSEATSPSCVNHTVERRGLDPLPAYLPRRYPVLRASPALPGGPSRSTSRRPSPRRTATAAGWEARRWTTRGTWPSATASPAPATSSRRSATRAGSRAIPRTGSSRGRTRSSPAPACS